MNITPKKTVLKNGVRLVTAKNTGTETVTVMLFFKTGSRYEDPKVQGISHFLEHMIFKGTKKRPNAQDISREIDAIGGEFNAVTSFDYTGYYIKAAREHLDLVFDILGDMLLNSVFSAAEIKREKGPVVEELRMYQDNPMRHIAEVSYKTLFGNTNLGRDIGGSEKTVRALTRKTIVEHYNKHYFAENLIVGVSGNISESQVRTLAKKHIERFKRGEAETPKAVVPKIVAPRVKIVKKAVKQINASIAFPAMGHNDPDRFAAEVLRTILNGGMSSRLFVEVRERRGLCYYIKSDIDLFDETGGYFIQSGLDPKRLDEALTTIFRELGKVKRKAPTAKEVKDAIEHVKGRLKIDMEDSMNVTEMLVEQEAFKEKGVNAINELYRSFERVTPADVQRVAKRLFAKESTCLTLIGPFRSAGRFEDIIQKASF